MFRTNERIVSGLRDAGREGQKGPENRAQGQEDQYPSNHIMGQGWSMRETRDWEGVLWERCHQ